ncbi:MAG TPA: hypothetical protein VHL98_10840 [Microvirga sp.]|jgi:hypothetical protein|nr:hypothetical protein [Microvirga sp.]
MAEKLTEAQMSENVAVGRLVSVGWFRPEEGQEIPEGEGALEVRILIAPADIPKWPFNAVWDRRHVQLTLLPPAGRSALMQTDGGER